jgi:hypothetical protein
MQFTKSFLRCQVTDIQNIKIMKKVFSFFLLIFIISFELYSQNEVECGTVDPDFEYTSSQPWFGNEEFLQHFSDSVLSSVKSSHF